MAKRVLVVEDEGIIALDTSIALENMGYDVRGVAHSGDEAIRMAAALSPDVVLMDIKLEGGMDGIEAARCINKYIKVPVIFFTAFNDSDTMLRAQQAGSRGFVRKPFDEKTLRAALEDACLCQPQH